VSTSVEAALSEVPVAAEDVEHSRPAACWSVVEGDWREELPADVVALLAPPVVVSAEIVTGRGNGKAAAYSAPVEPAQRFLTPAPPLPRRNRRLSA
jgi:hypothetical protein